jgi:CheY-like chemotaxis protein
MTTYLTRPCEVTCHPRVRLPECGSRLDEPDRAGGPDPRRRLGNTAIELCERFDSKVTTTRQARATLAVGEHPSPRALALLDVLVVDDDADTCELLRRVLEAFGAHVRTSQSVREALTQWDVAPPNVLVSDIGMPEQNGYALVRAIRRKSPENGGTVPAIALTAMARAEDRRKAEDAGFQLFFRKPIEPWDLVGAVYALGRG